MQDLLRHPLAALFSKLIGSGHQDAVETALRRIERDNQPRFTVDELHDLEAGTINRVIVIKSVRDRFGIGLAEAKTHVDQWYVDTGVGEFTEPLMVSFKHPGFKVGGLFQTNLEIALSRLIDETAERATALGCGGNTTAADFIHRLSAKLGS